MTLSHRVSITVPSTMGLNTAVDNSAYTIDIAKKLASIFGGSRIIKDIQGLYISENGTEVVEPNSDVIAYCETLTDEQIEAVIKIALELKAQMNQESILYEIDNIAYIE